MQPCPRIAVTEHRNNILFHDCIHLFVLLSLYKNGLKKKKSPAGFCIPAALVWRSTRQPADIPHRTSIPHRAPGYPWSPPPLLISPVNLSQWATGSSFLSLPDTEMYEIDASLLKLVYSPKLSGFKRLVDGSEMFLFPSCDEQRIHHSI